MTLIKTGEQLRSNEGVCHLGSQIVNNYQIAIIQVFVSVVKSLSKEFDDEAIRLTRYMPRWVPGTKNGNPVRYKMTMPINFKYARKKKSFVNEVVEN